MRLGPTTFVLFLVLPGFAQTTVPRLRDGHPDLTGFWNNANLTPLQRPPQLGDKQFFTADEAKAFEKARARWKELLEVRAPSCASDTSSA